MIELRLIEVKRFQWRKEEVNQEIEVKHINQEEEKWGQMRKKMMRMKQRKII